MQKKKFFYGKQFISFNISYLITYFCLTKDNYKDYITDTVINYISRGG